MRGPPSSTSWLAWQGCGCANDGAVGTDARSALRAASTSRSTRSPPRFGARSVQRERSRDDLACRLVRTDHHSGGGDLAVDELEPDGDRAVREQAFARPYDEGEDPQAGLIDEVVA